MSTVVLMSQWFAPSRLVITFERDGPGAFSTDEIRDIAVRGGDGLVLGLNLPKKSVLIANHQVPVPKKLPAVTSPLPLVGLCRLVVCLVSDVLYGYSPGRMHRLEEESPMGPCPRMGIVSHSILITCPSAYGIPPYRACNSSTSSSLPALGLQTVSIS